jgi:hypothetical protein
MSGAGRAPARDEKSRRVRRRELLAKVVQLTDFRDPLDECAADDNRSAVRRAINRLPSHYARILELRFGDELTVPRSRAYWSHGKRRRIATGSRAACVS